MPATSGADPLVAAAQVVDASVGRSESSVIHRLGRASFGDARFQ
ncbi:hypothetical protein [Cellulomonas sp. URHB0016]